MAKDCPIYGRAIYMDCLECEERYCKRGRKKMEKKKNRIVIGIDQSYKDTGVTVSMNRKVKSINSFCLKAEISNTKRRKVLYEGLYKIFSYVDLRARKEPQTECIVIIERIRLRSQGFLSLNYIKSMGALDAVIVDLADEFNFKVYSVDTRAWKSQVVGTSKPKSNKYGVDPKKWPTIQYVKNLGFESKILEKSKSQRKTKKNFKIKDTFYCYNDNKADSVCISLYGFVPDRLQKLQEEK